jgi:hypothetical protein
MWKRGELAFLALLTYSVAITVLHSLQRNPFERSLVVSSASSSSSSSLTTSTGNTPLLQLLSDESNVRIPRRADGTPMTNDERLRLLVMELKVGGFTNWAKNPRIAHKVCAHLQPLHQNRCHEFHMCIGVHLARK